MPRIKMGEPTRSSSGLYRRDLGWKSDGKGGYAQHRFGLGRDRADAMIRSLQLERVWDGVERRWQRCRTEPCGDRASFELGRSPRPLWDELTLSIAQAVARGEAVVIVPPPTIGIDISGCWMGLSRSDEEIAAKLPGTLALWLRELRHDFPYVRIEMTSPPLTQLLEREMANDVEMAHRLIETVTPTSGQSLHQALDAYSKWLESEHVVPGSQTPSQYCIKATGGVARLREHHEDIPLDTLGLVQLQSWVRYWQQRPMSRKGTPIAPTTAKEMVKRVKAFVQWLHLSPAFRWRKPADWIDSARVRIRESADEVAAKLSTHQVSTYSVDELTILYAHAKPWDRAIMTLALNCGFGSMEIEQLTSDMITLDKPHGHYPIQGSWIKRLRGKSHVYGEWSLWGETVDGIRWLESERKALKAKCPNLVVTKDGRPMTELTAGNNRNGDIRVKWDLLLDRVQAVHPGFRRLSYGKLRKTAADLIRRASDGETASVFLCHGKPVKDSLLDLYTNRDYRKVHQAIGKVRETLDKVFI